ncbi:hypothetical protein DB88DRAFT_501909 [Papiliotrema laurentii]|uniref:NADH dehydrogenase [ubiquinone] 1 alpha subcomplex subunit 12 n=1 Tax=Papiliotrema laurentii TaxID=5418 RepID=A0AAD9FLR2_PAPLA|nr:hypothetical protein DB88DRAFT_501909 [Papiliotrema laurentii]
MSGFFNSITKYMPFMGGRRFIGKDLLGNKYYEYPNPVGGRMRRVVKYKFMTKMSDYTSGQHRLPIQWTAWLAHTRSEPPSIAELQKDAQRQSSLTSRIAEIEAREREERISQGYITSDAPEDIHSGLNFPALGFGPRIRSTPSFAHHLQQASSVTARSSPPPPYPIEPPVDRDLPQGQQHTYPVPTPTSSAVPPPSETVDPAQHASKDDLRKLAEQDTKRRIQQQGGDVNTKDTGVQAVDFGTGGLKPRRRAKA